MAGMLGFWSYVHKDDQRGHGRVKQLAHDIVDEYEGLTAEAIELFLDEDGLHWGDRWRAEVDDALSNVAFFIPVLTPLYFKSPECRRELQFFIDRTRDLGIARLILPILYIDVPQLHEDAPTDPLMRTLKKIQWEPCTELRLLERTSSAYATKINKLANELVGRVREVEAVDLTASAAATGEDGEDDPPGVLERLAALEDAVPRWAETLQGITAEIQAIGQIVQRGGESLQERAGQGKGGFAARLTVARQMAAELTPAVERLEVLGQSYASDLSHIDSGMRLILEQAALAAQQGDSEREQVCVFINTINELSQASDFGLGAIAQMVDSSKDAERLSKDLRAPVRRMRNALTAMQEARSIINEWANLAAQVKIDCSPPNEAAS